LQNVLIRKPLVIDTVAATNHCLLVALDVPRKADARSPVVAVEAVGQRAIGNARSPGEAGEIDLLRNQERVQALRRETRIEDARAEKFIVSKTHAFPTETEVE